MEPRWLSVAYQELRLGIREIPGPEHTGRILDYHKSTTLKATTDEIPTLLSEEALATTAAR